MIERPNCSAVILFCTVLCLPLSAIPLFPRIPLPRPAQGWSPIQLIIRCARCIATAVRSCMPTCGYNDEPNHELSPTFKMHFACWLVRPILWLSYLIHVPKYWVAGQENVRETLPSPEPRKWSPICSPPVDSKMSLNKRQRRHSPSVCICGVAQLHLGRGSLNRGSADPSRSHLTTAV